jgi:hypothetical protein
VAETGSRLEEALRDRRRLEQALKAARTALNAIDAEVEVAHLAADGAEDLRDGMYTLDDSCSSAAWEGFP